jgi:hypothetical protein
MAVFSPAGSCLVRRFKVTDREPPTGVRDQRLTVVSTRCGRCQEIAMVSRLCTTGLGLMWLAGAVAPAGAQTIAPMMHPPAHFRLDFPRQGVMPGTPRDIAAARDFGSDETMSPGNNGPGGQGTVRKRRPRAH